MQLRLVFDSRKNIKCQFITLVVRNESLAKRYPGGRKEFLEKYPAISNPDLTVYSWGGDDFDDVVSELESDGLAPGRDFVLVDVFDHEWSLVFRPEKREIPHRVNFAAPWIAGRYVNGFIYVWAISSPKDGFPSQTAGAGAHAFAPAQEIRP